MNKLYSFEPFGGMATVNFDKVGAIDYTRNSGRFENPDTGILRITFSGKNYVSYKATEEIYTDMIKAFMEYVANQN